MLSNPESTRELLLITLVTRFILHHYEILVVFTAETQRGVLLIA